jgi:hypothetical protein
MGPEWCFMSGYRREVAKNCAFLGYYAARSGICLPIGYPETSLRNYHYFPNNSEERSSLAGIFITAFTTFQLLSLYWFRSIQFMSRHPSSWRINCRLSSYLSLGLPSGLFRSNILTKTLYAPCYPPYVPYAPPTHYCLVSSPEKYFEDSIFLICHKTQDIRTKASSKFRN